MTTEEARRRLKVKAALDKHAGRISNEEYIGTLLAISVISPKEARIRASTMKPKCN
jgi:hypothetical protein